jgi:hypothetical protein
MSVTYKGVTLFNDFDNDGGSFVAWEKLTLGALEKYFAQTHNLLIKSSQELEADIPNIAKGDTDVEKAERAKLISSDQNGLSHPGLYIANFEYRDSRLLGLFPGGHCQLASFFFPAFPTLASNFGGVSWPRVRSHHDMASRLPGGCCVHVMLIVF